MRHLSAGRVAFGATMIALGVWGLVKGDFAPVWEPAPKALPGRAVWAYLCAFVSVAGGLGLLWRRTAGLAARVLFVCLAIWMLAFRAPAIFRSPAVLLSWSSCSETAVMVAAAWTLCRGGGWELRGARALYGLSLIPFGLAHFVYLKQTAPLVPNWLPWHVGWAYFTGAAFLAAGLAVLTGVWARLASALSALQLGLFTLLVWAPIVAAPGHKEAFQWSETMLSAALTVGAFVVAESYRISRSPGMGNKL